MDQGTFKIRKDFLQPFFAMVALLAVLLLLSLWKGQPWEKILLAVSFIGTLLVAIEAAARSITVTPDGLAIKKFFRKKEVAWPTMTHLAIVTLNRKIYFLLTTTKGFYFFSNMFENHALLIRSIADRLDIEKVEAEVRNYLENPVERRSLIVICWVIVCIIAAFIVLKLLMP